MQLTIYEIDYICLWLYMHLAIYAFGYMHLATYNDYMQLTICN